jgi:CRISPR type III-A-associated protein Csm2
MLNKVEWNKNNWKSLENGDFQFNLKKIGKKTFNTTAEKWALVIANEGKNGVEKNQLRNFYDKVLELYEKSQNSTNRDFNSKVLPFIMMLRSKAYNARNRQPARVNDAFIQFIDYSLNQIDDKESFENFRYLFEAIMGFYRKDRAIKIVNPNENKNYNNRNRTYR